MKAPRPLIAALVLFLCHCSGLPEKPVSLGLRAPSVTSVIPPAGATVSIRPEWTVEFSVPMEEASMNATSVVLIPDEDVQKTPLKTTKALLDAIDDGDLRTVTLTWSWSEEGRVLTLTPEEDLSRGKNYRLILTPRLKSEEKIPLQPLAELPEPMSFLLGYRVSGDENFAVGDYEESSSEESGMSEEGGSGSEEDIPQEPEVPGPVVVNEIFYDAVGSDTDGVVFVELHGPAGKKIAGYTVAFVDGSDGSVDDKIILPDEARIPQDGFFVIADARTGSTLSQVAAADLIDNFDPQNGPDAVQLFDAQAHLIDTVGYGAGLTPASEEGFALWEGSPASDPVNGKSLERFEPGRDTDDNHADFTEREVPTPGL